MTTIQELIDFGKNADPGDQKSFTDLPVAVVKVEAPRQGQYGQMQRVQVKDNSGAWFFTAMDLRELHRGERFLASGRVKGNDSGTAFYNITAIEESPGQPPSQQAPASGGQQRAGGRPPQHERTVDSSARVAQWLLGESEGWPDVNEETRSSLVCSILISYLRGDIGPPTRRPGEQPQARQPAPPPPQPAPAPPAAEPEPPPYEDPPYEGGDPEGIPF